MNNPFTHAWEAARPRQVDDAVAAAPELRHRVLDEFDQIYVGLNPYVAAALADAVKRESVMYLSTQARESIFHISSDVLDWIRIRAHAQYCARMPIALPADFRIPVFEHPVGRVHNLVGEAVGERRA